MMFEARRAIQLTPDLLEPIAGLDLLVLLLKCVVECVRSGEQLHLYF